MEGKESEKWKQLLRGAGRLLRGLGRLLPPGSAKVITFLKALQCFTAVENLSLGVWTAEVI